MRKGEIENRLDCYYVRAVLTDLFKSRFDSFQLNKLVFTFSGGTPDKSNPKYWNGDIFWVSPKDFKGIVVSESEDKITSEGLKNSSAKFVDKENVLVVVRSGVLQHTLPVAVNKVGVAINQDVKALEIRDKSLLNPYYLAFYLDTFQGKLLPLIIKHGTTVQSVNTRQFDKIKIPVPPLEVQQQIIETFESAYGVKRAKEAEAKILLDSTDAYLLERLGIEIPSATETSKTFYVRYSTISGSRFDASAYRQTFNYDLSKFRVEKLAKLAFIDPRVTFKKLDRESEISFVPMEAINEREGTIEELRSKKVKDTKGFTRFQENDLIWAKITPCMQNGKSAVARNLKQGFACGSTEFYVIRPRTEAISVDYLHCLLRSKRVLETAKNFFSGSAGQQRVSIDFLNNFRVPVPPIEVQSKIAEHIKSVRESVRELEREARTEVERAKAEVERIILGEVSADA